MSQQQKETLDRLITTAREVAGEVQADLRGLSEGQLNWKPGVDRWSVAQCLDHLVTANESYFPIFDRVLEGELESTIWQRIPGLPSLWGALLLKSVSPRNPRKVKAPAIFQPAASGLDLSILGRFADQQRRLISYLEAARDRNLDAEKIIIPSPAAAWITYSLLDAFRIIVTHEQRHLLQAMAVIDEEGFPE